MSDRWDCPYDGSSAGEKSLPCGMRGLLCDRCKEDGASRRTDRIVQGLALAGFLAGNETAANPDSKVTRKKILRIAAYAPAAITAMLNGGEE